MKTNMESKKYGKCTNIGACHYAAEEKIFEFEADVPDDKFICPNPDCKEPLQPVESDETDETDGKKWPPLLIIAAVVLIGIIVACILLFGKSEPLTLSLDKKSVELTVGETDTLTSAITPEDSEYTLLWTSDNESVAMVASNGVVRAVGEGEANVSLVVKTKKEEVTAVCHYTIRPLPVNPDDTLVLYTRLSFVRERIEMTAGDIEQLILMKEPATGNEAIIWQSSDESVVCVDTTGLLTAHKKGSAKVTAISSKSKIAARISVVVNSSSRAPGNGNKSNIDLGYATYTGALKDGKPHGAGMLYFKERHTIPGTAKIAQKGEIVDGAFYEGTVRGATHVKNDGSREYIAPESSL